MKIPEPIWREITSARPLRRVSLETGEGMGEWLWPNRDGEGGGMERDEADDEVDDVEMRPQAGVGDGGRGCVVREMDSSRLGRSVIVSRLIGFLNSRTASSYHPGSA